MKNIKWKKCIILISIFVVNISFAIDIECADGNNEQTQNDGLKWYRDSSEMRALYHQVYNVANQYIDKQTKGLKPKSWGIVLDIDETVLDNSWYSKECNAPSQSDIFSKYVVLKELSVALPDAVSFTCSVKKRGGYVSLVSNRDGSYDEVMDATVNNLKKEGICFDQVILANQDEDEHPMDKNPRFKAVSSGVCDSNESMVCSNSLPKHKVIAYFGDNIQDFPNMQQKDVIKLNKNDKSFDKFGNGYFILPNPYYGSWMSNQFN